MKKLLFLIIYLANPLFGQDKGMGLPPSPPPVISGPSASPADEWAKSRLQLSTGPVPSQFELSDFSGGLNYRAPSTGLAPNEALVCQNWLFSREGGLQVRPGFGKVNSSVIDLSNIAGLYHYSLPLSGKGFLVAESTSIYKMTDAGTFADSQIYFPIFARIAAASNTGIVIEPQDKWLLEKLAFLRYEVLLNDGVDKETLNVRYLVYNADSSRYQILYSTNSDPTINTSTARSYLRYRATNADVGGSTMSTFSVAQRNNTIYMGTAGQRAVKWDGLMAGSIGFYAQGMVNDTDTLPGANRDTAITCDDCNFSTNEVAGKILVTYGADASSPKNWIRMFKIIQSNTATKLFFNETDSSFSATEPRIRPDSLTPFTIWNPCFTAVDSGTVDSVYQGTGANKGITYLQDNEGAFNNSEVGARIIEFLTGPATGLQRVLQYPITSTVLSVYQRSGKCYPQNSRPRPGDKYVVWDVGLSARYLEFYYDCLIAAGLDFFPNTIVYSLAGYPDRINAGTQFLTLPEQGGDSIVFIANTNGLLAAGQKHRLWVLVGPPPWTGQTVILAADGIGCIAPRSVVKDGKFLYFVGLRGNIPTVFRWQVEGATVNTAGGGTLFQGGGLLEPLTEKIDPMMMKLNRSKLDKISAGLFGEHLLVSMPFGTSTVNDSTIAINLRTGAISTWTLAAGLWHNGRAAGDTGQVYFTEPNAVGTVFLYGGATDSLDTAQSFTTLYQTGWQDFGNPTLLKQGIRQWAQQFRSSASGTSIWKTRVDFGTSDQNTFTTTTTTGERDENSYMSVAALGKRFGFRFEGAGLRGSFLLKGLAMQFSLRGSAP